MASTLPRSYEAYVQGRVKFRVGRIVYLAFSRDEELLGFAFPKEWRTALVESEPEKYMLPRESDLRFNWAVVRLAAIDEEEMRELVIDAWAIVVPKSVAAAYAESHGLVWQSHAMVPEAPMETTEHGRGPTGDGWFVLNAREAHWRASPSEPARAPICDFEGEREFPQLGINLNVLAPGQPMAMYHWEADQEDFLVLAGEAVLIVEGVERPLRQWDFVHCPAGAEHTIVGAGQAPCLVLAVGARDRSTGPEWGGYGVDEAALRHAAGVEQATTEPAQAYARFSPRGPRAYRDGWLPN